MTEVTMPRGWKRVPLPDAIEALPKDKKGFPIPYVAEWSHDGKDLDIREMYAVMQCSCEIGVGVPELGNQCPMRQRECMVERKCQVCARLIPVNEDCYFLGGLQIATFWEPPLHKECAIYSLQVCPGITRRPTMSVVQCRDYRLFDKFEFNPSGNDIQFVPHGRIPLRVSLGAPAVLTFHGAQPIKPIRMLAGQFLEVVNG